MNPTTPGQIAMFVGAAAMLAAVFELLVTGGSFSPWHLGVGIFFITAFPWSSLGAVFAQLLAVLMGGYPVGIDPFMIGLAGALQGALVAGVVLGLLRLRTPKGPEE